MSEDRLMELVDLAMRDPLLRARKPGDLAGRLTACGFDLTESESAAIVKFQAKATASSQRRMASS